MNCHDHPKQCLRVIRTMWNLLEDNKSLLTILSREIIAWAKNDHRVRVRRENAWGFNFVGYFFDREI